MARTRPKSRSEAAKQKLKKKLLPAVQVVASCLRSLGNEETVEDYLEDMGISEVEEISVLRRSTTAISNLLNAKAYPVETDGQDFRDLKELDQYFVFRQGSSRVMLVAPMESFRCNKRYSKNKPLGVLRRPGYCDPLMLAFPGRKACADAHDKLLDSEIWAEYVHKFAKHIEFKFRGDGFDKWHDKEEGSSFASHVEPKLMLFFACYLLVNRMGHELNLHMLWLLHNLKSRIEADIFISEEPCTDCKRFKAAIETHTGLKFSLKVCQNLGILKPYRDEKGRRKYPRYPEEDSELDEEDVQMQLSPALSSTSKIMVLIKSNTGTSTKTRTEVHVTSVAKREPRRRKRQYEEDDDNEDYEESPRKSRTDDQSVVLIPRTRARVRSSIGVMTPAASFPHRFIRLK